MHRSWHDRLDSEMKQRGVPAHYRRRLLAEASEHAEDLMEEEQMKEAIMEARMGAPAEVATTAAEQYRLSTWTRRHPRIVFGLLPVPLLAVLFVCIPIVYELVISGTGWFVGDVYLEAAPRWLVVTICYALAWVMRFVPFAILAWFFTRRYIQSGVHWGWYAVALTQLLFLAGTFISTIQYSDMPGESAWQVGFAWIPLPTANGWNMPLWSMLSGWQVLQLIVPSGIAWLMVRMSKRRQIALS